MPSGVRRRAGDAETPWGMGDREIETMRKYWLIAVVVVFVAGCSSEQSSSGGASSGSPSDKSNGQVAQDQGNAIHLTLHKVMDTEGTGKLACTYLLPDGYSSTDTLKWNTVDYLTPVVGTTVVKSDDGQILMESMSGLQLNFGHSPGGNFGSDPPSDVCAYLLGNWKKQHPGLDYVILKKTQEPVPELTQNVSGLKIYANHGVVELQYTKGGTKFHVKCNVQIYVMQTIPATTAIGGTIYEGAWVINYAYTVTAPEERFPEAMKMFGLIMSTSKTDPHFFNTVVQAQQIIERNFYSRQRQIMETSRIISQTNDEILDSMNKQYQTAQTTNEHELTGFDDYIRGIDRYDDAENNGGGAEVSLPSGYAHAFSDGFGKYIVTDEHGYDPNVGGPNGTWHEMEKRQ